MAVGTGLVAAGVAYFGAIAIGAVGAEAAIVGEGALIGGKISGYTSHGLDQKITRGVASKTIMDTVTNPLIIVQQAGGKLLYLTSEAAVVLSKTGQVITTYGKNDFLPHITNLLNQIK